MRRITRQHQKRVTRLKNACHADCLDRLHQSEILLTIQALILRSDQRVFAFREMPRQLMVAIEAISRLGH